jgi:serine/threonine protein kinase
MKGDSIDPQSPQLTATGQTLGTLEYMSPEQLMGKQLDGRSDVYALGVLAYEMITGRLPFPEAKGPAGLITAQLKQTPVPPSQANPQATLPRAADRVILKCLEKDKNNRFPDVSALAVALQDAMTAPSGEQPALSNQVSGLRNPPTAADLLETRRGDLPNVAPPPMPPAPMAHASHGGSQGASQAQGHGATLMAAGAPRGPAAADRGAAPPLTGHMAHKAPIAPAAAAPIGASPMFTPRQPAQPTPLPSPYVQTPSPDTVNPLLHGGGSMQLPRSLGAYPPPAPYPLRGPVRSSKKLLWWVVLLLAVGAGVGTAMALLLSK